jgi:hypothetical protein
VKTKALMVSSQIGMRFGQIAGVCRQRLVFFDP